MTGIDRLPSVPLITTDPYFSVWMGADTMTEKDTEHWTGAPKPIRGTCRIDGKLYRFLGAGEGESARLACLRVTPTRTVFESLCGPCRVTAVFAAPAFPDDPDMLSMPVTLVTLSVSSEDGMEHDAETALFFSDRLCCDGGAPDMAGGAWEQGGVRTAWRGKRVQAPLCHSGDHVTQDWGYLYAQSKEDVLQQSGGITVSFRGLREAKLLVAYDDIASVNYFGSLCRAWYARDGRTVSDALKACREDFDGILLRCKQWDERVEGDALAEGEEYACVVRAAFRHVFAAHKLIATPKGEMALLSKENDSNGCIGTVDVSYPSIPLFLKYAPELVNALARPVLEFARMDVWKYDFAPHDVGRYPYATGQVYASPDRRTVGEFGTFPPYYAFPPEAAPWDDRDQMPVEECGNMLVMLEAAREFGADRGLADEYADELAKWVRYLLRFGEDPGEQLCTDDFAGHLAHNVNLAMKAVVGVACYARLSGDASYGAQAKEMAQRLLAKIGPGGDTPLTLDGSGWSMKYNLLWDRVLGLGLFPADFYDRETRSYVPRVNAYGLPLDSRADYTKSDWIAWTAAMADDASVRRALLAPLARYIRETPSRVPFSDWYDTKTARYESFIARSVQGGLFAPMLPRL